MNQINPTNGDPHFITSPAIHPSEAVSETVPEAVRTLGELSEVDIVDLYQGETLALHIPNYLSPELCDQLLSHLPRNEDLERYDVAPEIKKLGKAIFDAATDPHALSEYYDRATRDLKSMRALFSPYLSPIDRLRLDLQELWTPGSVLESFHGQTMFCGLVRVFNEGVGARPHQDMAQWDVPDSEVAQTLSTQLAVNIYMSDDVEGGELELWSFGISEEEEYQRTKTRGDYGLDRSIIGPPATRIKPKRGDLIIFNAQRIHAVQPVLRGTRVAVSSFIGYRGVDEPLTIFS